VPCYNEEKVLIKTLESLRKIDYPNLEVIVVDDGSTDDTFMTALRQAKVWEAAGERIAVCVASQSNKGKAAAINHGIRLADGKYILCVDADSTVDVSGLDHAVSQLEADPKAGAVAGYVEVSNKDTLLTRAQDYEYQLGLIFNSEGLASFGIVPVIPGPIGLFRKSALDELQGFREGHELMAEDCELALRMSTSKWKVLTEPRLKAHTEAPETLNDLLRQRYRWNRGILQSISLNVENMIEGRGRAKLLAGYMLFESYGVLVINLAMLLMFSSQLLKYGQAQYFDIWILGLALSELIMAAIVVKGRADKASMFVLALLNQFTYNVLMIFWRAFSFVDEMLAKPMGWDKLTRKGS
jgi:cellulose synthase/poly-beta-1,6-N-acetylglucosamine synthase-like glycosyltransferase